MMLWMKCRHVFSSSTSRAPVQAHYLLSDSILHYKNLTSKQCEACGIFEHASKKKEKKTMNKNYLTIFDCLRW